MASGNPPKEGDTVRFAEDIVTQQGGTLVAKKGEFGKVIGIDETGALIERTKDRGISFLSPEDMAVAIEVVQVEEPTMAMPEGFSEATSKGRLLEEITALREVNSRLKERIGKAAGHLEC